jgi:DNA-binding transcriptional LysR family regulator
MLTWLSLVARTAGESSRRSRSRSERSRKSWAAPPRGVVVTPAGRALLPDARAAERGGRSARAALALEARELEIGTVLSMAVGLLPHTIRAWHERHPTVAIRLHEFLHRRLLEDGVRSGVGDLAIGPRPLERWDGPLETVGWEEFVLVTARSDPLAACKSVRLETLAEREWVLYHPDHGLAGILEQICGGAGFALRGTVRTSQAEGGARLAAAGLGLALVPDNIVLPGLDGAVLQLEPRVTREVVAYTRTEWSPRAAASWTSSRGGATPAAARRSGRPPVADA